jgi:hypothetical protein
VGVVTDQVKPVPQHHERLELHPFAMPGELEIANAVFGVEQLGAQRSQIIGNILQERIVARTDVGENPRLMLQQGDDGPFIEHALAVAVVHFLRARLNEPDGFA